MLTAFFKYVLMAVLLAASLSVLAPLSAASGSTSGGAAPTASAPSGVTLATWFGPGFYGRSTACGQTMSPTLVGVANRTLPCGTLVRIGYRGRQITVPVLDRGPYAHNGAVWDLTTGAARALKIDDTVSITAEVVGSVPNTPTLGEPLGEPTPGAPSSGTTTAPSAAPATTGGRPPAEADPVEG